MASRKKVTADDPVQFFWAVLDRQDEEGFRVWLQDTPTAMETEEGAECASKCLYYCLQLTIASDLPTVVRREWEDMLLKEAAALDRKAQIDAQKQETKALETKKSGRGHNDPLAVTPILSFGEDAALQLADYCKKDDQIIQSWWIMDPKEEATLDLAVVYSGNGALSARNLRVIAQNQGFNVHVYGALHEEGKQIMAAGKPVILRLR